MPAINPSKPYLVSASFNPSVLRAAERAAGGRVGSTLSIGGQGSTLRSSSHSLPKRSRNAYISGNFLPVSTCKAGNGTRPKKALRASQIMTLESLPSDQSSAIFFSRANASRMMKTLCASSASRWSMFCCPDMALLQNRREGDLHAVHFRGDENLAGEAGIAFDRIGCVELLHLLVGRRKEAFEPGRIDVNMTS